MFSAHGDGVLNFHAVLIRRSSRLSVPVQGVSGGVRKSVLFAGLGLFWEQSDRLIVLKNLLISISYNCNVPTTQPGTHLA